MLLHVFNVLESGCNHRYFVCISCLQALSAVYIIWRSCRSCVPGWLYLYSLPVLAAEAVMVLMGVLFMLGVWNQLERQDRCV